MNHPQSIIVYRSRAEQVQDEFISENPEAVLIFLGALILVAGIWLVKNKR